MGAEAALKNLREAKAQHVLLDSITMDADLQPRRWNVVQYGERIAAQKASENHAMELMAHLTANPKNQLTPVLLAKVGARLLVVDGFHRVTAYCGVGRNSIPARVCRMRRQDAVMAAKLANLDNRTLPLHRDQKVEVRWQQLRTVVTLSDGKAVAPKSAAALAGLWGIDRRTIGSMLTHLPWVVRDTKAGKWNGRDLDSGTGLPYWIAVKRRLREKHQPDDEEDELTDADVQRADRIAAKLVPLLTGDRAKVIRLALQRTAEAIEELEDECEATSAEAQQLREAREWLETPTKQRRTFDDPHR